MSEETPDISPEVPDTGPKVRTISQHIADISPLLTEGDIRFVLQTRKLSPDTPLDDLDERDVDLAVAEAYLKLCDQPVGGATNKEVDGSWSSTTGGWTVSGANIAEWYRKYAALREKWGEEVMTKRRIRIINL